MNDLYFELLGIPPQQRPPTPWQLLGIDVAEVNPEAIRVAAERQLARLRPDSPDAWKDGLGYRQRGGDGTSAAVLDEATLSRIATEIASARDALLEVAKGRQNGSPAPAAGGAGGWWQAEVPPPPPSVPTAPAANWWQDSQADPAPKPPPAPTVASTPSEASPVSTEPSVSAPGSAAPQPAAPAPTLAAAPGWWSEETKPASSPCSAPATGWWQESVADPGPLPPPVPQTPAVAPAPSASALTPVAAGWWQDPNSSAAGSAPMTSATIDAKTVPTGAPASPAPASAPAWWSEEVKPASAPAKLAPAGGWWADSVAEAVPSTPTLPGPTSAAPAPLSPTPPVLATPASQEAEAFEIIIPPPDAPLPIAPVAAPMPPPLPVASAPPDFPTPAPPVDDDEYAPRRRRTSESSPLPWIALGLIVVGGAAAGGVWFMTQNQKPEPSPKEVAAKTGGNDYVPPDTTPKAKPKRDPRPKKNVGDPAIDDPMAKIDDPMTKIDMPPKKKEVDSDPVPPPKKLEFNEPATFKGHQGMVASIAAGQNGQAFLTTSDDRKVILCSLADGSPRIVHTMRSEGIGAALCENDRLAVLCDGGMIVVYDLNEKETKREFENPRGGIRCLAATPDGRIVLAGATDGCARWWSIADNKLVQTLDIDEKGHVIAAAISPDGGRAAFGLSDGQVALWDLAKAKAIKKWKGHNGRVNVVTFAPDGKLLASFGDDGQGHVWGGNNAAPGAKLIGHKGPVLGAGWCADGQRIVSGGIDQKILLWNAATGKLDDWSAETKDKVMSLAVDPRDRFVLAGQSGGVVQLFPLPKTTEP